MAKRKITNSGPRGQRKSTPSGPGGGSKSRRGKPVEARSKPTRPSRDQAREVSPPKLTAISSGASPQGTEPGWKRRARSNSDAYWLYGQHPVLEALQNPERVVKRLLLTNEAQSREEVTETLDKLDRRVNPIIASREDLEALFPVDTIHQGVALMTDPLEGPSWPDFLNEMEAWQRQPDSEPCVVLALDQVTDPHNVGAVLRSAAAFGARAVLAPWHHAPGESAVLAKSASGALEHIPYLRVGNLTKAMGELQQLGFWSIGLAAEGAQDLASVPGSDRTIIVLGAEGHGLRRLTRERCDFLARLPTRGPIGHLNVSNAAAVALYALLGKTN